MLLHVLLLVTALTTGCASGMERWHAALLPPQPANTAPGLRVTWLGTAGFLISDGTTRLLVDPFVSRAGILAVALRQALPVDDGRVADWIDRVGAQGTAAVLVTHSHYDHAMDAPAFAQRTGAQVVGSPSTCNVALGYGLAPERCTAIAVSTPTTVTYGDFRVTFRPSEHGPALFGRIPYPGTIDAPLKPPASASAYKLGATYGLVIEHPLGTIVHHGSASWLPDTYRGVQAEVVLLGLAGRADTAVYVQNVVRAVGAKRVVPMHFDDFFRSLDQPLRPLVGVNLDEFFTTMAEAHPDIKIEALPLAEPRVLLP